MEKSKKTRLSLISLALVIVLITMSVATVYAVLFSSTVPVDSTVTVHVIGSNATDVSISNDRQNLTFTAPGDKINLTMQLQNKSDNIFRYYYKIGIGAASTGLESAILVYLDDEFMGTLGELCSAGEATLDKNYYVLGGTENTPTTKDHKLTFELHNAAADTYYGGRNTVVTIDSYAVTPNYQTDIFVTDEASFFNAVNDVNYGAGLYTIRLCSDLTLTQNYSITRPCNIDLFGNELIFGDYSITLAQDGVVTLFTSDSVDYSSLTEGNGGFVLNSALSALDINEFSHTSSDQTPVVTNVSLLYSNRTTVNTATENDQTIYKYNASKSAEIIIARLAKKLKNGLNSGVSVAVFGSMLYCGTSGNMAVALQSGDYSYNATTKVITAASGVTRTFPTSVSINGTAVPFEINSTGDSAILTSILSTELAHIPDATTVDGEIVLPEVTADLFLPTQLQNRNASIEWWSSNQTLIKNNGKLGDTAQGEVALVATIRINNSVFSKVFNFTVYRQDNEMKFQYLLALMNPILLSEVYNAEGSVHVLPIVDTVNTVENRSADDYRVLLTNGNDLGLISLEYSIEPVYYYMTVADDDSDGYTNDLYLNQATFQAYAQINVKGTFDTGVYEGTVGVEIELGSNADLQNTVFKYVQGKLNEIDVLQNIINTRVANGMANENGDFTVPTSYMGFTIVYNIPIAKDRLQRIVNSYGEDSDYTALISWATGSTSGTRADAVVSTIDSTVAAYTSDGNATISSNEEAAILLYCESKSYAAYSGEWEKYITTTQRSLSYNITNGIVTSATPSVTDKNCLIGVSPVNFYSIPTDIPIDVTVYMEGSELGGETRALTFGTPAAVHIDDSGFASTDVFRSVKLQIWQQLPVDEKYGIPINSGTVAFGGADVWTYILMRDLSFAKTLVFENGSEEDKLTAILGWAASTENIGQTAAEIIPSIDETVANNASDGKVYISAAESAAILNYCSQYEGFATQWANYTMSAYNFTSAAQSTMKTAFDNFVDTITLSYTSGGATDTIDEALSWATHSRSWWEGIVGDKTLSSSNVTITASSSTACDGSTTISQNEGTTISNVFVEYGFNEFAQAWTNAMTEHSVSYSFTLPDGFAATILSKMKTLIKNRYTGMVNWAIGSDAATAASSVCSYLSTTSTYTSNSLALVSLNEAAVLKEFATKISNGGTGYSGFASLWDSTVPQVTIYADGGQGALIEYVNGLQDDSGSTPLLELADEISVGMDAVLSEGYDEKIGNLYRYTGTTTGNYTQNTIYKLSKSGSTFSFTSLGIPTQVTSSTAMASVLENATAESVGAYYLFTGTSADGYKANYLYLVSQDAEEAYYFENMGKPYAVSQNSGSDSLYYGYVSNLDSSTRGLNKATNLKKLLLYGSSSSLTPIFTTATASQSFFNQICQNNGTLTELCLNYCSLNDISTIGKLQNVTSLSLLGNTSLVKMYPLLDMNVKDLSYLELTKTGLKYNYSICTLSNLYYTYYGEHSAAPSIYYTNDSGTRTLFAPALTTNEQTALIYLYYLREPEECKGAKMALPAHIYIANSTAIDVTWSVQAMAGGSTTSATVSARTADYNNLANNCSGTATTDTVVLMATITVNGESYTRFFSLKLGG